MDAFSEVGNIKQEKYILSLILKNWQEYKNKELPLI
jgi:hypothetical protein